MYVSELPLARLQVKELNALSKSLGIPSSGLKKQDMVLKIQPLLDAKAKASSTSATATITTTTTTTVTSTTTATTAATAAKVGSKRKREDARDGDEKPAKKLDTKPAAGFDADKRAQVFDKLTTKVLKDALDVDDSGFATFNTNSGNVAWNYLSGNAMKLEKQIRGKTKKSTIFATAFSIVAAYSQYDSWMVDNEAWQEQSLFANILKTFGQIWQQLLACDNSELEIDDVLRKTTMGLLRMFRDIIQNAKVMYESSIPDDLDDFDFVYKVGGDSDDDNDKGDDDEDDV